MLVSLSAIAADRPNVIVIMVDDMGYGGLSSYDNAYFETPEIDRLAADGVKLTDFHSNGALCSPSRAALLTGRYQQRSGCDGVINADPKVPMHHIGMHDSEWTFPEAMKTAGYATGLFGKWHLGYKPEYNPTLHGFDEFKGFVSGNIDAHSHYDRMVVFDWYHGQELVREEGYHSDLITDHAVSFIESNQDQPFFMYVAHATPHSPHQARASAIVRGPDKGKIPAWAPDETYSKTPGADDWFIRHFYLPVDDSVARIRAKVEELGLAENTVIWFISDNGGTKRNFSLSEQTREGKNSMYEGGHRVPGMVWAPGRITPGSVSDELILGFDIMPTSMATAEIAVPDGHQLDGIDVRAAIFDGGELPATPRYWNAEERGAARDGDWKLVVHADKLELFDLGQDPRETTDLSVDHPARTTEMHAAYLAFVAETTADSPHDLEAIAKQISE